MLNWPVGLQRIAWITFTNCILSGNCFSANSIPTKRTFLFWFLPITAMQDFSSHSWFTIEFDKRLTTLCYVMCTRATLRLGLDCNEKQQTARLRFSYGSRALFTGSVITNFKEFFFKIGSHGTIHTFKNYFATMFSVFSNKRYPNRP